MGIVKGSHFYLHLITQKRPEYIIGILPPFEIEEKQTIIHSFEKLGNQNLKSIYHNTNAEDNTIFHSVGLLGNQQVRDIYHILNLEEKQSIYHTFEKMGNQLLREIYHNYNTDEKQAIIHSFERLDNMLLKFSVIQGQNDQSENTDKDRFKHSFELLGNQELKEI